MHELRSDEALTTTDIANPDRARPTQGGILEDRTPDVGRSPFPSDQASAASPNAGTLGPLFPEAELGSFRSRWEQIQASFVDEPRQAVEQADNLVANTVKRIAEQFSSERAQLEQQWDRGGNVSTEELRQALKRYRSFFNRLLAF